MANIVRDPKEQVGITTNIVTKATVPSSPHSTPVLEYPVEQEVFPQLMILVIIWYLVMMSPEDMSCPKGVYEVFLQEGMT